MNQSILVTGADGFIGRSVVPTLERLGYEVIRVTRRPSGPRSHGLDLRGSLTSLPRAHWVVHLAGGYAGADLSALRATDGAMAANLLRWGAEAGVRGWVFASAAEVYGPCHDAVGEESPPAPRIPYGRVKLEVEHRFTERAEENDGTTVAILRIGEVYGPSGRLLNELGRRFRSGFCPWFGSGDVPVSFVHVDDVARAVAGALENAPAGPSIWNVADDEPVHWRTFLDHVARLVGGRPVVGLPLWLSRTYAAASAFRDRLRGREPVVTQRIVTLLTTPKPLSNRRLRDGLRVQPRYADIRLGLTACFDETETPRNTGPPNP